MLEARFIPSGRKDLIQLVAPFALSLLGSISDYITTTIGLSWGYVETHPHYSLINSIMIFWAACLVLEFTLPKGKWWQRSIIAVSLISFLGFVNNSLVFLGVFGGLVI